MRFFEEVTPLAKKYWGIETILPTRGSKNSACYDFRVKETITLKPGEYQLVFTDVKAFMCDDEVLELYMRSSAPLGLILKNLTGIIDSDYYGNPKNDGNIGLPLWNIGSETIVIPEGERICQGKFTKYLITNDDEATTERAGGMGSTGKTNLS